jgi:ABC-type multidrug transport system ATPase subunit
LMASQLGEMVEPLAARIAILEGARLKAYDTLEALRARTGCSGSLSEVYERLVHPQTLDQIENYFSRPKA